MSSKVAIVGTRGHYARVLDELARVPDEAKVFAVAPGGNGDDDVGPLLRTNPEVFPDFQAILDRAAPDVLVVCGPFERHAEMSIAAIERGVHVLTEKPVALTLSDLDRLSDALARHPGVHLAGMMFSRYDAGIYAARQLIRAGAIGEVRLINARKSYKFGKRSDHFYKRETYGGTIPWVGSHAIDWAMWFADQPVTSVYATHLPTSDSPERAAVCHLAFGDRVLATISIDYYRPDLAPTHGDDWARVVGTDGVIEARPDAVHLINADNDGRTPIDVRHERPTLVCDFLAQVSAGGRALIDRDSTIELTRICLLARDAADAGGRVVQIDRGG